MSLRTPSAKNEKPKMTATLIAFAISCGIFAVILFTSPNFGGHVDGKVKSPVAGDFLQEWIGAYTIRKHGAMSLFDKQHLIEIQHDPSIVGFRWNESGYFAMVYPPFYYAVLIPISFLPYRIVAWMFALSMIGCFFAAHMLLVRSIDGLKNKVNDKTDSIGSFVREHALKFLIASTIFIPVIRCITTGQKGTVCLLILAATFYFLSRKKNFLAGLAFGFFAFKPQLALVIGLAMLFRGRWRFVAGSSIVVGIAVSICLMMGIDVSWAYAQFCMGAGDYAATSGYDLYKSHHLLGFLTMLSGSGSPSLLVKLTWITIAIAMILGLVSLLKDGKRHDFATRMQFEFAGLTIATILLAPHLFTYDLAMILVPIYLLGNLAMSDRFSAMQRKRMISSLIIVYAGCGLSLHSSWSIGFQWSTLVMLFLFFQTCLYSKRLCSQRSSNSEQGIQFPSAVSQAF